MTLNNGYVYAERIGVGGATVLEHLTARYRQGSREQWLVRIEGGEVRVDRAAVRPHAILQPGAELAWSRPPWDEPDVELSFETIFEDEALIAVIKPRGLPTLPGGGFLEHTLLHRVRAVWPRVSPMHRLGRETSGIVLFARDAAAGAALQTAFRERRLAKRYRAVGVGVSGPDGWEIAEPIGPVPHPWLGTVFAADPRGRPSHSRATVLERRSETTLFDVEIETGRPHQIRIHLACIGHALVGDPLYAAGGRPRTDTTAVPGDGGYFLHAERLGFPHPRTGAWIELRAPPPVELRAAGE